MGASGFPKQSPLDYDFNDHVAQAMGKHKRPIAFVRNDEKLPKGAKVIAVVAEDNSIYRKVFKPYKRIPKSTAEYALQNHWRGLDYEIERKLEEIKKLKSQVWKARRERAEAARRYKKVAREILPELKA